MQKIINSNTAKYQPMLTDNLVLDDKPTVNSFNTVTSDGVARAIAGASGEVPAVTESDNGKVLTAVYDEGGAAVEWADAQGGGTDLPELTGNAGKVLKVNSGATGVEWANDSDTDSNFVVTTSTKNDELIAAYTAGKLITAVRNGETYLLVSHDFEEGEHSFFFRSTVKVTGDYYKLSYVTFTVYALVDSTATVTFGSTTNNDSARVPVASSSNTGKALMSIYDGEDGYAPSWQTVRQVPTVGSSDNNKVLKATYSGGSGSFAWADAPASVTVDQTYNASSTNAQSGTAVAGALATIKQVPASTSADEDKVLTVNSSGNAVWAAAQGGGGGSSVTIGTAPDVWQSLTSVCGYAPSGPMTAVFGYKGSALTSAENVQFGSGPDDVYGFVLPDYQTGYQTKTVYVVLFYPYSYNNTSFNDFVFGPSIGMRDPFQVHQYNSAIAFTDEMKAFIASRQYPGDVGIGLYAGDKSETTLTMSNLCKFVSRSDPSTIANDASWVKVAGSYVNKINGMPVGMPSFNTSTDVGKVLTVTANGLAWVLPA